LYRRQSPEPVDRPTAEREIVTDRATGQRSPLARTVADLTADWFSAALSAPVVSAELSPIGTGQMSQVLRAELSYDIGAGAAPSSVIVKVAAENEVIRQTGLAMGFYPAEIRFYQEIAGSVGINAPDCFYAEIDATAGWFTLVMNDRRNGEPGNMLDNGTPAAAASALRETVALQASRWNDPALREAAWLQPTSWIMFAESFPASLAPFLERFGERMTTEEKTLCERVMPYAASWLRSWSGPMVIQHGDYRPDNLLFGPPGERPTVFDWQTVRVGPPYIDPGNYIIGSLTTETRRAHQETLLRDYHGGLVAAGVAGYDWGTCWEGYRASPLYGVHSFVGTSPHVQSTPRGDELYFQSFRRYAAAAIDLNSEEFLP
jgi:Phosphotransferase enzyme family